VGATVPATPGESRSRRRGVRRESGQSQEREGARSFASHGFPRSQHRPGRPPFTRTDARPAAAADSGPHLRTGPPVSEEEARCGAPAYFPRRPARAGRPPPRAQTAPPAPAADSGPHCMGAHLSWTRAPLPLTRAPLPLPARSAGARDSRGATHHQSLTVGHIARGGTCQGPARPSTDPRACREARPRARALRRCEGLPGRHVPPGARRGEERGASFKIFD
jgi:hypothetical protein